MLRNIIVCIAFTVGGLCFGVMYLAYNDEYQRLLEGKVFEGVVEEVSAEKIKYSYVDERGRRVGPVTSQDAGEELKRRLKVGDRVKVHRITTRSEMAPALHPPSPWYLATLAVLIFIGALFILLPIIERRRLARAGGDPIKVITLMLRKARFNTLIIVLLFCGLTYLFFGVGFLDWDPEGGGIGGKIVLGLLAAVCALVTVFYLRGFVGLLNIPGSWILKTIRDHPGEIAWIYESVAKTRSVEMSRQSTVYIWFADGKSYTVPLGQTGAKEFITALAARAPHAQIGYTKELEQQYRENPSRFRPGG